MTRTGVALVFHTSGLWDLLHHNYSAEKQVGITFREIAPFPPPETQSTSYLTSILEISSSSASRQSCQPSLFSCASIDRRERNSLASLEGTAE